jgi:tryptophan-rich sensory protein
MGTTTSAAPRRPAPNVAIPAAWAAALVAVAVVGALGSDTTSAWYRELDRPSWQPPGAVFGPVWTTLYVLIAVSATLATRSAPSSRRRLVVGLFAANLVLNVGWTWIFFQAHAPVAAGIEIVVLLATIVALIRVIRPHHRGAAALLVPYLAWVSFATVLTWTIAATNG